MASGNTEKKLSIGLTPGSEAYVQNLNNSIVTTGNNYRVKKLLEKLKAGKTVYVAAIGGSVTEGGGPEDYLDGYAFQFAEKFQKAFPAAKVVFDGAGLSGTPSSLGVVRYEKDVVKALGHSPDLLIIEFAVNDGDDCTGTRGFERIIRNVLEAENDGAVIPVYAHASYENNQATQMPVADFYKLPQISLKNALKNPDVQIDLAGGGEYFTDYAHPTTEGHGFMADCLMNLLKVIDNMNEDKKYEVPAGFKNENPFKEFYTLYSNVQDSNVKVVCGDFCDKDPYSYGLKKGGTIFPDNWHHTKGTDSFKLELECKSLIFVYKVQATYLEEKFGQAVVLVDGKVAAEYDGANSPAGAWNNNVNRLLIDETETKKHTVEVKMKDGDENKGFSILAIGYSK